MWFRIANVCFRRTPFPLFHHHLRCKLYSSVVSVSQVSTSDEFLTWLRRKSGEEISSVLSIGNSIYGRSLIASAHIQAGDCILKVPYSAQLTPDNLHPEIKSLLGDNVENVIKLAIVILMERKLGQDSEWAPYINSLPPVGEMHSTIFWSKEELEMIQQSLLYKATIFQQTQIEKEFSAIRPAFYHFPQFFECITFDDFRHAFALGSRAWGISKDLFLVPFADFLNHDGHSDAILQGNVHNQASKVIAVRDYVPGEQVLITYGKHPNFILLLLYGFTISYNIYDQVQICIHIPEDDPLRMMKLELWHKHHMSITTGINFFDPSGNSFIIKEVRSARGKGEGIPQSLRAFLRVLCADSPQELDNMETEAAKNDGRLARRPLSVWKEIQAHQILLSRIVDLIQEYDASIKRLGHGKLPSDDLRKQMSRDLLTDKSGRRQALVIGTIGTWFSLVNTTSVSFAAEAKKRFLLVLDKKDGYEFLYPFGWQEVIIEGLDKVVKDVIEPLESASVTLIETSKQDIRDLGSPQEVVEVLIKKVFAPSSEKTKLIEAKEVGQDEREIEHCS